MTSPGTKPGMTAPLGRVRSPHSWPAGAAQSPGKAWPDLFFAGSHSPSEGCAAASIPWSSWHLHGKEMALTLWVGKPSGRFSAGANQHSFTRGQGAIPIHPKWKSGAERWRDALLPLHGLTAALGTEGGHPGFLVWQYCWRGWKSHAALSLFNQPSNAEDWSSEPARGFPFPSVAKIHCFLFAAVPPSYICSGWQAGLIFADTGDLGETL